jgi:serine/threonine-protein kinase HipA
LAGKLKLGNADVLPTVKAAVEATLQSWSDIRADLPIPEEFKRRIEEHWKKVPLLRGT